jgi:hypothetical protein
LSETEKVEENLNEIIKTMKKEINDLKARIVQVEKYINKRKSGRNWV